MSRFSKIAGEMVPHETVEAAITKILGLDGEAERKIAVVFGCGGERDPGKRPLMGRIAGRWAELPVIIVSSRDEDECRQETKRLGATAHLAKPVSGELVAKMVDRLLGTKRTVAGQKP